MGMALGANSHQFSCIQKGRPGVPAHSAITQRPAAPSLHPSPTPSLQPSPPLHPATAPPHSTMPQAAKITPSIMHAAAEQGAARFVIQKSCSCNGCIDKMRSIKWTTAESCFHACKRSVRCKSALFNQSSRQCFLYSHLIGSRFDKAPTNPFECLVKCTTAARCGVRCSHQRRCSELNHIPTPSPTFRTLSPTFPPFDGFAIDRKRLHDQFEKNNPASVHSQQQDTAAGYMVAPCDCQGCSHRIPIGGIRNGAQAGGNGGELWMDDMPSGCWRCVLLAQRWAIRQPLEGDRAACGECADGRTCTLLGALVCMREADRTDMPHNRVCVHHGRPSRRCNRASSGGAAAAQSSAPGAQSQGAAAAYPEWMARS